MTTIVCFHAHPDDESIGTGGTIARAVAAGHRVVLVLATRGERGEPTPGVLSEGEMLCMGEMTPPSTWYIPRYWRVFSTDSTSATCSTTQIVAWSRSRSAQIGHTSSSERLLHCEQ